MGSAGRSRHARSGCATLVQSAAASARVMCRTSRVKRLYRGEGRHRGESGTAIGSPVTHGLKVNVLRSRFLPVASRRPRAVQFHSLAGKGDIRVAAAPRLGARKKARGGQAAASLWYG